ncbi:MAG: hypothetical protein QXH51_06795 [Candidatus Bathyarchaeia archaeon]
MESIAQTRRRDPAGFPDWTYPITITGMTIESLAVSIVAQAIPALAVDIKAQSIGNLNVNIAACAVTLNVNIAGQTATLNVSIQSSAVTLNVSVTNAYLYVRTESTQALRTDIVAQSVGNIAVNIAAQSLATLAVDIKAQSVGNLNVNIAGSAVTLNVAIQSTAVTLPVSIQSSAVTLNVNIAAQAANLAIDIKAQSVDVKLLPDWAAVKAADIDILGSAVIPSDTLSTILSYTVPTGKTLLIYVWNVGLYTGSGQVFGYLYNATDLVYLSLGCAVGGFSIAYTKPIRVGGGKTVKVVAVQRTGASQEVDAHIGGVLI